MQVYKAIKYIRLSYTDDKTVESDSVANQRRLIDDYIARHPEIEVVAEKIDDGYSGVLFDRPAFQEMMRMIEQGEANCVIVKDLSRLGREYIETGRYMRRVFPAYGVRFIAINDNVDTENDAADDLTVSVKNIMNEAYCRDISVKTRSALEVKRRSGDFVGAFTIYGYVKVGDKHKSLEVDEYAANVVRDIFRKRLEGFSASHIADELNRLGILSPLAYKRNHGMPHAKGGYTDRKDCKWSATTIIRILQDETYTGTLVQGKQTTPHFKLKEREDKPGILPKNAAGAFAPAALWIGRGCCLSASGCGVRGGLGGRRRREAGTRRAAPPGSRRSPFSRRSPRSTPGPRPCWIP